MRVNALKRYFEHDSLEFPNRNVWDQFELNLMFAYGISFLVKLLGWKLFQMYLFALRFSIDREIELFFGTKLLRTILSCRIVRNVDAKISRTRGAL